MTKKKAGTRQSYDKDCLPVKEKEELELKKFEFSQDEIPILSVSFVDSFKHLPDVIYFLQFVTENLQAKLKSTEVTVEKFTSEEIKNNL